MYETNSKAISFCSSKSDIGNPSKLFVDKYIGIENKVKLKLWSNKQRVIENITGIYQRLLLIKNRAPIFG